jgi:hypothetical protein
VQRGEALTSGLGDGASDVLILGFESAADPSADAELERALALCHAHGGLVTSQVGDITFNIAVLPRTGANAAAAGHAAPCTLGSSQARSAVGAAGEGEGEGGAARRRNAGEEAWRRQFIEARAMRHATHTQQCGMQLAARAVPHAALRSRSLCGCFGCAVACHVRTPGEAVGFPWLSGSWMPAVL